MNNHLKCLIFLFLTLNLYSQEESSFEFINSTKRSEKINFLSINNMIVISVEINGMSTNFLVDTGLNKTLLFSFDDPNLINTELLKRVRVRGFGGDEELYAYQSIGNQIKIGGLINKNAEIYLFFDNKYNLTNKLGVNINGVIGYELFKDFLVRINYQRRQLKFYNPDRFNRRLSNFERKDIEFYKNKPYIKIASNDYSIHSDSLKLLIDTGSSDALWLIDNENLAIREPNFKDVIGYGFVDLISGKRSKLKKVNFGKYQFDEVNVAYPDSISYSFLEEVKLRDGSFGSEIMRRFIWFMDYPNSQLFYKASRNFDDPFIYDMSGLVLKYGGVEVVKKTSPMPIFTDSEDGYGTSNENRGKQLNVSYEMVNQLKIAAVRPNSPAYAIGLLPDDVILEIDGKPAYQKNLEQLTRILSSGHDKKVKLKMKRFDEIFEVILTLKDRLKELEK